MVPDVLANPVNAVVPPTGSSEATAASTAPGWSTFASAAAGITAMVALGVPLLLRGRRPDQQDDVAPPQEGGGSLAPGMNTTARSTARAGEGAQGEPNELQKRYQQMKALNSEREQHGSAEHPAGSGRSYENSTYLGSDGKYHVREIGSHLPLEEE